MKTRIICACIVILILTAACTNTAGIDTSFNKASKTPMAMGHYSLMYMPDLATEETNISGTNVAPRSFRQPCGGQFSGVHARFGRSLFHRCSEPAG